MGGTVWLEGDTGDTDDALSNTLYKYIESISSLLWRHHCHPVTHSYVAGRL
jgi:hypothetical protein